MKTVAKTTIFLAFINGMRIHLLHKYLLLSCLFLLAFSTFLQAQVPSSDKVSGRLKTVVIDAGHGGHDPGCLGESAREKTVCLNVALRLGRLITNYFPDVRVIYTRDTDVFVKLHERAQIANDHKADLFISIHANSAQSKTAKGTESYVMGTKYTDKNLEISKRENAVILLEDDYEKQYDGYDPNNPIMDIIAGLYQQLYLEQSINFANKVEYQFESRNGRASRGVKQRVLLVMYRTAMPSVLIEVGFLTNEEDHALLVKESGQVETAAAIFRAFLQYKREVEGASPLEIASEEKLVHENWKKIFEGDSALIEEIRPDSLRVHQKVKVEDGEAVAEPDLILKVQITSSSKKIPLNSRKFSDLEGVEEYQEGDYFKYTVGRYTTMKDATEGQQKARDAGFKDAFLVAFYKGERVSIKKARTILNEN